MFNFIEGANGQPIMSRLFVGFFLDNRLLFPLGFWDVVPVAPVASGEASRLFVFVHQAPLPECHGIASVLASCPLLACGPAGFSAMDLFISLTRATRASTA
jgi:hypothetical protein